MEDYKQRRQREAAQTEQAILQAAMRLCRQKAFDKVSVREICSLAGITTGAFYHHFPSKEALLAKGILSKCEYGYKVLGNGKVTKKVTVEASAFSASAKEAIEAAGGKAEVM